MQQEKDTALTNIAFGAGIMFTGILVGGALQYIYHILLARYLGPDELGIFVLGLTVATLASSFSRLGFEFGIVRYVSMYRGMSDTARAKGTVVEALKLSGIASVILGALLFLFSPHISAVVFHIQGLSPVMKILCLTIPFSVLMSLFLATCQAFYIARYTALIQNFLFPFLNIILAFLVLFLGFKALGVASVYLVSLIIVFGLSGYFLIKVFPDLRTGSPGIIDRKELLIYSVPLLGVSFLTYLVIWTDSLMLGFFKGSHEVGIYSTAAKTSMLLLFILYSLNFIFSPLISDLYNKRDFEPLERMFKTVTRWAITFAFPAFLFTAFWPKEILSVFGVDFIIASTPLIILALGQFINVSTGSVGSMLVMIGKNWIVLLSSLITLVLNLILNYIFIPRYGIIGASMATAFSISFNNILNLLCVYLILKIHPYDVSFFRPVCGGIIALFLSLAVVRQITAEWGAFLVVPFVVFTSFYGLTLILFCFNEEDKKIIQNIKKRILTILRPI